MRSKLLVDSVDAYVLAMPSPVNRQKRCLHPVVRERQTLVVQLQSLLRDLGLERRAKQVPSLQTYLAARAQTPPRAAETGPPPSASPASPPSSEVSAGGTDISGTVGNETAPAQTRPGEPT